MAAPLMCKTCHGKDRRSCNQWSSVLSDTDALCIYRNSTTNYLLSMKAENDLDVREGAEPISLSAAVPVSGRRNLCETKTVQMIPESIPAFPRGVKYRFDAARSAWIVLSPERVFLPDETGQAILSAVDGTRTVRDIASALAVRFDAPLETIEADVLEMLSDLALSGVVQDKGDVG